MANQSWHFQRFHLHVSNAIPPALAALRQSVPAQIACSSYPRIRCCDDIGYVRQLFLPGRHHCAVNSVRSAAHSRQGLHRSSCRDCHGSKRGTANHAVAAAAATAAATATFTASTASHTSATAAAVATKARGRGGTEVEQSMRRRVVPNDVMAVGCTPRRQPSNEPVRKERPLT